MSEQRTTVPPRELTEADLQEARKLIGVELRRTLYGQWNNVATKDAIAHFCDGISDENPLYRDADYAAGSVFGKIVAPHMFLVTVDRGIGAPGLPGVQYIYGKGEYEIKRRIHVDETLSARVVVADAKWLEGSKRPIIDQIAETTYFNSDTKDVVAIHRHHTFRVPRRANTGGLAYKPRQVSHYSEAEIEEIWKGINAEEIRGKTPRPASSVKAGDLLQPVVKPPLSIIDILQWYAGAGCLYRAHEMAWKHFRTHPGDAHIDPLTNTPVHAARGHLEGAMAGTIGMPGVYDVGNQRISWLAQLVEYWMGDSGRLVKYDCMLRRPNIAGDVSWCRGKVVANPSASGFTPGPKEQLVDLELWIENQLGEITTKGQAVVALPTE